LFGLFHGANTQTNRHDNKIKTDSTALLKSCVYVQSEHVCDINKRPKDVRAA